MIVSLIVILYLAWQTYKGYQTGFTRKIVNLILSAIIFVIAIIFQNPVGNLLYTQFTGASAQATNGSEIMIILYRFAAFFVIFFIGRFLLRFVKSWLPQRDQSKKLSTVLDSVFGAIVSFVAAYFFVFVVISMLNALQVPWFIQQTINSPFLRFIIYNTPGLSNGAFNTIFSISRTAG